MKQYPADFRDRLSRAIDAGLARAEAAWREGAAALDPADLVFVDGQLMC